MHKSRMIFFLIFTFASQRRLLELLSYGEYNQLVISVICFLKTSYLSASRFYAFIFFLMSNKVYPHIFLLLKNIDHSNRVLKILNNENLKKFQSRYRCSEIHFERTQNWKTTRSFCAKILSRIFSIIPFVLWQVLKPPLQKVILKRILRQRVFQFHKNSWKLMRRATLYL